MASKAPASPPSAKERGPEESPASWQAVEVESGRPLQIVKIDMEENCVSVVDENIELLHARLQKVTEGAGVDRVSVVSVMGAYRTGKSFLLDLFLRYLRRGDAAEHAKIFTKDSNIQRNSATSAAASTFAYPSRDNSSPYSPPSWLTAEGGELEGQTEASRGFHWRPGMEKCTEGIWIWSEPFLRKLPETGETVAVLLMDTQGAWDSRMTKEQSSTIFGLTAVLSSKQIYNISKQIQEDKVENLHHFMECAKSALRIGQKGSSENIEDNDTFQSLEFLVRDWPNFEEDWTVEECMKQMDEHLAQHMSVDQVREGSTIEAISKMFGSISCFLLPHPGLLIEKKTWKGDLNGLDTDFIKMLDVYVRRVFTKGLAGKNILGNALSPLSFTTVVKHFVEAFKDAIPNAPTFVEAMAKSSNLLSKETAIKRYKSQVEEFLGPAKGQGVPEEKLEAAAKSLKSEVLSQFSRTALYGPEQEIVDTKRELEAELRELLEQYRAENRRRMEKAMAVFAGVTVLAVLLYLLDRLTDYACDWYSDTCVSFSKVLFISYSLISLMIGTHAFLLWQNRGQAVATMALLEMVKSAAALSISYAADLKGMKRDREHLMKLVYNFGSDCSVGLLPIYHKILDFMQPHLKATEGVGPLGKWRGGTGKGDCDMHFTPAKRTVSKPHE